MKFEISQGTVEELVKVLFNDENFKKLILKEIEQTLINDIKGGKIYNLVLDGIKEDIKEKVIDVLRDISSKNSLYPYDLETKNIIHGILNKKENRSKLRKK